MAMTSEKPPAGALVYFIGIIAWIVPGGGHCAHGLWGRGVTMFITICTTFFVGLLLGGIEMIDPPKVPWFYAQIIAGGPAILATLIQSPNIGAAEMYGRGVDLGQVYAGVAGLLNLLCILDALMLNHTEPAPAKAK